MSYTTNSEEVIDAIRLLNVNAKILPEDISSTILEMVISRFTDLNEYEYSLWENMISKRSVRRQYAWEVFNDLLRDKEVILFFDYADDKHMFLFVNGSDLTSIFENCFKFIFYITNIENEFLLAYNNHDYLIGAGDAIKWIDDIELGKYNGKE